MAHLARIPDVDNSLGYPHLNHVKHHLAVQPACHRRIFGFSPEMTANFTLPCSSLEIRSASSINRVPKPYVGAIQYQDEGRLSVVFHTWC